MVVLLEQQNKQTDDMQVGNARNDWIHKDIMTFVWMGDIMWVNNSYNKLMKFEFILSVLVWIKLSV